MSWRGLSLALAALFFLAPAQAEQRFPGVVGDDDRRAVDTDEHPYPAIGRVNVAGFSRRSLCTGTLIAPDLVLTAAHCVIDRRTGKLFPLEQIHFVAGRRRDGFAGHGRIENVRLLPGFEFERKASVRFFRRDVAVLKLTKALQIEPVEMAQDKAFSANAKGRKLAHILYSRNRPFLPAIDETCSVLAAERDIWASDCDTNFGGSGGPVFFRNGNQLLLAGVMVGIVDQKASFVVPLPVWKPLLEPIITD